MYNAMIKIAWLCFFHWTVRRKSEKDAKLALALELRYRIVYIVSCTQKVLIKYLSKEKQNKTKLSTNEKNDQ